MIVSGRLFFWIAAGTVFSAAVSLPAQTPLRTPAPAAALSRSPGVLKSPVELFRELLKMSPAEREQALAGRTPENRRRLLEKLSEYQILPPEIQEWRLRETELRWHLLPLMKMSRANRPARLALVPEDQRQLVIERLQVWDVLPSIVQTELLNSDTTVSFFTRLESAGSEAERQRILRELPPEKRAELEEGFDHWRRLSDAERQRTLANFNRFFQLTPEEKERALDAVPDDERKQMESTLDSYAKLTPELRARCLQSFQKFAGMSLAERQLFLKNAERWREMSPEERQAWRDLVASAPVMPSIDLPRRLIPLSGRAGPAVTN